MKKEIKHLFHEIKTQQGSRQSWAFVHITALIDLALQRGGEECLDELHLKKIYLTKKEANDLIKQMSVEIFNEKFPIAIRLGMVGYLGQFDKISYLKANLKFLKENYPVLDDQEVYSILVSINPQYFNRRRHTYINKLLDDYGIRQVLQKIGERKGNKAKEALFHMWGKIKLVGPVDKQDSVEYFKSTVWKINNDYELLDNPDIYFMLKSIPNGCFAEKYREEVRRCLNDNNFIEILSKLETRTYETYCGRLRKSCPKKLKLILRQDIKEKAKEKKEYEKAAILLKRRIKYIKDRIK